MNPVTKLWAYLNGKKSLLGLIAFGVLALVKLLGGTVPEEAWTIVGTWTGVGLLHKGAKRLTLD